MKCLPSRRLAVVAPALLVLASADGAGAADMSPGPSLFDWSGYYFGGHLGVAAGTSAWTATQPGGAPSLSGSLDLFQAFNGFNGSGSQFGGFTAGYNYMLPSRLVIGAEADVSFASTLAASQGFTAPAIGAATYSDTVELFGTVRGRVGYDVNHWLYYVTGGLAWTYDQFNRTQIGANPATGAADGTFEAAFAGRIGWTAGAGVEAPVAGGWSLKAEYLYAQFGNASVSFPQGGQTFTSGLSMQEVRLGLNYRLGDGTKPDALLAGPAPLETDNWLVHGQTTYVNQYAPPFHAPYRGANSLDSNAGRETWDATLYIGRRLWEGGGCRMGRPGNRPGFRAQQYARHCGLHQRRSLQGRLHQSVFARCLAPSSARPSTSAAKPRRSRTTSTSSRVRRPRTGW